MQTNITVNLVRPSIDDLESVDVDFQLELGELELDGEVTLVRDHTGSYASWGEPANWLDGRCLAAIRESDANTQQVLREIASVCGEAADEAADEAAEKLE